jgi:hypothetical protein
MSTERYDFVDYRGGPRGGVFWVVVLLIVALAGLTFAGARDFGAHLQAKKLATAVVGTGGATPPTSAGRP